jgi:limonene 1,2-monooxygenase
MAKMRFGIFMPPFNCPPTQNATVSLQRNLETIQLMDRLGYDEVWVGEHHSAGTEIIADPLVFIAHAGATTKHIKLGTGVVSLPYHNPLWIADRAILVDHLIRGRLMLGIGPGSLPTDATMIGLDPADLRPALAEDIEVLVRLLTSSEPVTKKTARYNLVGAKTQLAPFTDPCFEIVMAATQTPTGASLAGTHGLGMLSLGATTKIGFDVLAHHWGIAEKEAKANGKTVDRKNWRLVGPMHIAETRKQALEDVRYGYEQFCEYTQDTLAFPAFRAVGKTFEERIAWINETGLGVIGTPEDAVKQIERLDKQSEGGFGAYLMMQHDWANWNATQHHYELFARHVAPYFQPSQARLLASEKRARSMHSELDAKAVAASKVAQDTYDAKQVNGH